jgi:hypothetical protein
MVASRDSVLSRCRRTPATRLSQPPTRCSFPALDSLLAAQQEPLSRAAQAIRRIVTRAIESWIEMFEEPTVFVLGAGASFHYGGGGGTAAADMDGSGRCSGHSPRRP